MVTTAETSTALTNTTGKTGRNFEIVISLATPTCPELKVLILELNGLSINEVNETERELTNAKYTKYCFDCDAQMDSCVLVGFYVFRFDRVKDPNYA